MPLLIHRKFRQMDKYLLTLGLGLIFSLFGYQNKEAELARIAELEEAIEAKEKALAEQERHARKEAKRLAEEKAAKEAADKKARLQKLAQL